MTFSNWEYERAASGTDATAIAIVTVAANTMLVIDSIQATEFDGTGGELILKRNSVPLIWATVSHDCVDLLAGSKIRLKAGSSLTLDIKANIHIALSGALYEV